MPKPIEVPHTLHSEWVQNIANDILKEIRKAEKEFPCFPIDPLGWIAIIGEEYGEAVQSVVDYRWERRPTLMLTRKELVQTAAMCFRSIGMIDRNNFPPEGEGDGDN